MASQGGLINTNALAHMYKFAEEDPLEDSTIGLWDTILHNLFQADDTVIIPNKRQPSGQRPDFIIRKFYPTGRFIELIVVEGKPQYQTASQDISADYQVLGYANEALAEGRPKGQTKVFAMRVVGVKAMFYEVRAQNPTVLRALAVDYLDPKFSSTTIVTLANMIKASNVF
ncbi:MAG: hypothetical protein M1834_007108 [Cirrosporium novae-zelandiae]|nr:MAG: hypothetical protein M1834_007108 [Cirrosporium novae-zelandiae]